MKATNIVWDTKLYIDILPTEIEIPEEMTDADEISDFISDMVGYRNLGFDLKE